MKALALLLAFASPAAFALDFAGIQNWTGTGANQAALVIDFDESARSFAWGYRFDGARSGFQMLEAIAAADPLLDFGVTTYSFGRFVTSISYGSLSRTGDGSGGNDYFGYLIADNTATQPTAWSFSNVGSDDRVLGNGSWDAYVWNPSFPSDSPAPIVAAAPVPEPATMAALGIGALALLRRRQRA